MDENLVTKILSLVDHESTDIHLALIEGLPAMLSHCNISKYMITQMLKFLSSNSIPVVDNFCDKVQLFLPPKKMIREESVKIEVRHSKRLVSILNLNFHYRKTLPPK